MFIIVILTIFSRFSSSSQETNSSPANAQKSNKSQSTTSTLRRRTLGSSENRFILKKRLFNNTREIPSDPIEVSLLYAQAVHSVVTVRETHASSRVPQSTDDLKRNVLFQRDELPVSEKVALQLAGLQAQVSLGDPQQHGGRPELYSDVEHFLPQRIKQARFLSDKEWIPILAEAHNHYGAGKAEVVAKVWYLSCVMQYPLYGCTMFPASYKGYWSYGCSILLGVNCDGIIVVKTEERSVLFEFPYCEMESLLLDPSDNFVTVSNRGGTRGPLQA